MSIIEAQVVNQDLKFIQLKVYQISPNNQHGSNQCLAIDHNQQTIFVCCNNDIVFVPLSSLLNFDVWVKEFLKNVEHDTPQKISFRMTPAQVNSHLVSISNKGYGSKLAVACLDSNKSSLFILFYDLNSIYQLKEKSISFNQLNLSVAENYPVKVRLIAWHPEYNDNVFACSLTNGSFYLSYVADSNSKVVTVFHHITNSNISAFSWSPKGKQIVLSYKSHFVQYKFQINEKNPSQTAIFQEFRKVDLLPSFSHLNIKNIHWLSTYCFFVICNNQEETSYLLITIPPTKATGSDAIMRIVNFGCLVIDSIFNDEDFVADIFSFDNAIFTFNNKSCDFALIGCQNINETSIGEKWCEITIDDVDRLCFSDTSVSIRGLNFTNGTSKVFKMSSSVEKGGVNRPFAITYDSKGQLTLFLIDYQNDVNENFLKIPVSNTTLKIQTPMTFQTDVRPNQLVQTIEQPKNLTSNQPFHQPPTLPMMNIQQTNIKQNIPTLTINNQPNFTQTPINNQTSKLNSEKTNDIPLNLNSQTELDIKALTMKEIKDNIKQFDTELKSSIVQFKNITSKTEMGGTKSFEKIKCETEFLKKMLEDLTNSYTELGQDLKDLQLSGLDFQYLIEETQSLLDRNTDPKYRNILQQRTLDPLTLRRVKEINSLKDYIEIQLRELNNKFELEWMEWLQKEKRPSLFASKNLLRSAQKQKTEVTSPFRSFLHDGGDKGANSIFSNNSPKKNADAFYKVLSNNQLLIDNLRQKIQSLLKSTNQSNSIKSSSVLWEKSSGNLESLVDSLKEVSLNEKNCHSSFVKSVRLSSFPFDRKLALRKFLENRQAPPIRQCGPCSGESSEKSRFVSVLEKIKSKISTERSLSNMSLKTHQNVNNSDISQHSQVNMPISKTKSEIIAKVNMNSNSPKPSSNTIQQKTEFIVSVQSQSKSDDKKINTAVNKNPVSNQPQFENISPVSSPINEPIPSFTFKLPSSSLNNKSSITGKFETSSLAVSQNDDSKSTTKSFPPKSSTPNLSQVSSFLAKSTNEQQPPPKPFITDNSPKFSSEKSSLMFPPLPVSTIATSVTTGMTLSFLNPTNNNSQPSIHFPSFGTLANTQPKIVTTTISSNPITSILNTSNSLMNSLANNAAQSNNNKLITITTTVSNAITTTTTASSSLSTSIFDIPKSKSLFPVFPVASSGSSFSSAFSGKVLTNLKNESAITSPFQEDQSVLKNNNENKQEEEKKSVVNNSKLIDNKSTLIDSINNTVNSTSDSSSGNNITTTVALKSFFNTTTVTTASGAEQSSAGNTLFANLKPSSVPSFSNSLFGNPSSSSSSSNILTNSSSSFSFLTTTTTAASSSSSFPSSFSTTVPESSAKNLVPTVPSLSFSFNNAFSSLSSTSTVASSTTTTTTIVSNTAVPSTFQTQSSGSFAGFGHTTQTNSLSFGQTTQRSSLPFGQANQANSLPFGQTTQTSSLGFGQITQASSPGFTTTTTSPSNSSIENNLNSFKICSPEQQQLSTKPASSNVFNSFSFGGGTTPANPSTSNFEFLSQQNRSSQPQSSSLFSSPTLQNNNKNSLFGNTTSNLFSQQQPAAGILPVSSTTSPSNLAFQPFGSSSNNSNVNNNNSFNSSFGGGGGGGGGFHSAAPGSFGGSPTFGGSPVFGGTPTFKNNSFSSPNQLQQQPVPSSNQMNNSFFRNFSKNEPMPSFGSLASETTSGLGGGGGGAGGGSPFNSGSIFKTNFSQNSEAFTQRRG